MTDVDRYLTSFASLKAAGRLPGGSWLDPIRERALERFAGKGFPTTREEAWKYTSVDAIRHGAFDPAPLAAERPDPSLAASEHLLGDAAIGELVFVNGRFHAGLSRLDGLPDGLEARSLAEVVATSGRPGDDDPVAAHLETDADEAPPFGALNTALFEDGAWIRVRRGHEIPGPLHLLFLHEAGDTEVQCHPRIVIRLEPASALTLVETHAGAEGARYLTNAVTDIELAADARLDHTKAELDAPGAFHVSSVRVRQGRGSDLVSRVLAAGGRLVRNDLVVTLAEPGASCRLDGLFLASGDQHVDNHTVIDHAEPHCTSRQLYKGVLDGEGRGVFNGRVLVRPHAQQTSAEQQNRNLLLSEAARIDTKPELEIYADDVKCSHGATIGQLEEASVFYLRSRGIPEDEARSLLTCAFAEEIVMRIPVARVRQRLMRSVARWLDQEWAGDEEEDEA